DKTADSYILAGLAPATYYVRVRTYTPAHANNQSALWSDYSEVVSTEGSPTPTNLLQNGDFESGVAPWLFYSLNGGSLTTAGPAYAGNAAGRAEVRNGSSNVQVYQTGFPLEPQTRYRLSFAAYSSSGQDLALVVHRHSSPYTNHGLNNFRINLSRRWRTFTVEFTTRNLRQATTDTRLRFWLAPYAQAGDVYWIDDVVLTKVTTAGAQNTPAVSSYGTVTGTAQLPAGYSDAVILTLVDLDSDGANFTRTTTAAADGAFAFADVPAGTYELRATGPAGTLSPEPYQWLVSATPNESMDFIVEPVIGTIYLPLIER
ncbi:MAG: carbohydrate binding domain-containing protein, partial [Caldilineaceae bacterium]|nr:carbohydrate binding domain-containing protein [Caldilineaceae bacterium]